MSATGAGETLGDRYELERRIATGGMGEVWRGLDSLLGRPVAVKVLKTEYADDPDFLERFRAEARHTAALSHSGIANVFDYGEVSDEEGRTDQAYLVMELVDGEPLSALLSREGALPPERAMDVVAQAAAALQAAHDAGVVHRDVKPGNLLVRPDGVVKVTDFGIARAADSASLTAVGTVLGTAYYLSPEQAAGGSVTPASDVYALGVVAYEMLAGRRPFSGDNAMAVGSAHVNEQPPPLPDAVPAPVRALVDTMLAKEPGDRPASAGEVARHARRIRDGLAADQVATGMIDPQTARTQTLPAARRDGTSVLPAVGAGAAAGAAGAAAGGGGGDAPRTAQTSTVGPPGDGDSSGLGSRAGKGVVVALLVAVLALVVVALLLANREETPQVGVPAVTGSTYPEAVEALQAAGLEVEREEAEDPPQDAEQGTVLEQDPAAGTQVDEGSTVTLQVVGEPETVQLDPDDYVGRPFEEVRDELEGLDLSVTAEEQRTGEVAPGTVVDLDPTGEVETGTSITVTVAAAPRETSDPTPTETETETETETATPSRSPSPTGSPDSEPTTRPTRSAQPTQSAAPTTPAPTGGGSTPGTSRGVTAGGAGGGSTAGSGTGARSSTSGTTGTQSTAGSAGRSPRPGPSSTGSGG